MDDRHCYGRGNQVTSHQISGLGEGRFGRAEQEDRRCPEGAYQEWVAGHAGNEHDGKDRGCAAQGAPKGIFK